MTTTTTISDQLRRLADWLEEHGVTAEEVTCCSVMGGGQMKAQLTPEAVCRLCEDVEISIGGSIHGVGRVGDVRVAFCV